MGFSGLIVMFVVRKPLENSILSYIHVRPAADCSVDCHCRETFVCARLTSAEKGPLLYHVGSHIHVYADVGRFSLQGKSLLHVSAEVRLHIWLHILANRTDFLSCY